jgi:hypothetical protein
MASIWFNLTTKDICMAHWVVASQCQLAPWYHCLTDSLVHIGVVVYLADYEDACWGELPQICLGPYWALVFIGYLGRSWLVTPSSPSTA